MSEWIEVPWGLYLFSCRTVSYLVAINLVQSACLACFGVRLRCSLRAIVVCFMFPRVRKSRYLTPVWNTLVPVTRELAETNLI